MISLFWAVYAGLAVFYLASSLYARFRLRRDTSIQDFKACMLFLVAISLLRLVERLEAGL
jgi:hypothetical protein